MKISNIVKYQSHILIDGSAYITGIIQAGASVNVSAGVVKNIDYWESDAKEEIVTSIWRLLYGDVYRQVEELRRTVIAMPPVWGYTEQNDIVTRCDTILAELDALS